MKLTAFKKALAGASIALVALFSACASGGDGRLTPASTAETPSGVGTISGTVSVGPLCPVEPCASPVVNPYEGMKVVVSQNNREIARFDVAPDGSYKGTAEAGEYRIDIDPCEHLGCSSALPKIVKLQGGQTATVNINIDTGIR